jgi:hypothetical protein
MVTPPYVAAKALASKGGVSLCAIMRSRDQFIGMARLLAAVVDLTNGR